MSTISSNQEKRHGLVEPIYVLVFLVLILALLLLGPLTGNANPSISGILGALGGAPAGVSASTASSLTTDQQYWEVNCTRGWPADSTCEAIEQRVQSCSISTASAYCSAYDRYLEQFRNQ